MRAFALLAGLFFCISCSNVLANGRVALVIGNGAYQAVPALTDPKADAVAIGQMLRDAGFDRVEVWTDLNLSNLKLTLSSFKKTAQGADAAVIYFAGHAFAVDGVNFIVPVDARLANYWDVWGEAIPLQDVMDALAGAKQLKLAIMDTSRDNSFVMRMRPDAAHGVSGWTTLNAPTPSELGSDGLIAYAAKAGSLADPARGRSQLANALIKWLPVPGRDLRLAFAFVKDEVIRQTSSRQEPFVYGAISAVYLPLVPATATKMQTSDEEKAEFEIAKKINTRAGWQAFLGGHPAGLYASLADAQLETMSPAASAQSAPIAVPAPPSAVVSASPAPAKALAAASEHRVALVIGNSAYKSAPELPNPRRDAQLIADALKNLRFDKVVLANDLSREAMIATLRNFASDADKADWAVIYYAGHGIEAGGINYMIPIDAKLVTDRDVQYEAVPLDQVMSATEGSKKLRLVLLDACRNNPFANRIKRTMASRAIGRGLAQVEPDVGTLVVFAAKDGQVALDGDGQHSPFAEAVAKNLPIPGVEINKFFRLVRDDVMDATARQQQPFVYGSVTGREDFYFVRSATVTPQSNTPAR